MDNNQCNGLTGKWFGHNFESRFEDAGEELSIEMLETLSKAADDNRENLQDLINTLPQCGGKYLFDICTRCGIKVDKSVPTVVKCQHCGGFTDKG